MSVVTPIGYSEQEPGKQDEPGPMSMGAPSGYMPNQQMVTGAPPGYMPQQQMGAPPGYMPNQPMGTTQAQHMPQQQMAMAPIMTQPGFPMQRQVQWMPLPQGVTGSPPGLAYLSQIDQLLIHQTVELMEVLTDFNTQNRFVIKNTVGQQIYFAHEEANLTQLICCGPSTRGFIMHVQDNTGQEVIRMVREFRCCARCNWCACVDCCAHEIAIEAPVGTVVGYVRQARTLWKPYFTVEDSTRDTVLNIHGPCCGCQEVCCSADVEFEIFDKTETEEVGKICKQWGGLIKEAYTNATNFTLSFPVDLSVQVKACLLAGVLLIDYMLYEKQQNRGR